jgi:hypothetical protein
MMIAELKEEKAPTIETTSPPFNTTSWNDMEIQKEEEKQNALQETMLTKLVECTSEVAVKNLFTSLEWISNELRKTTRIEILIQIGKTVKDITHVCDFFFFFFFKNDRVLFCFFFSSFSYFLKGT